jgi:hypothetical protein
MYDNSSAFFRPRCNEFVTFCDIHSEVYLSPAIDTTDGAFPYCCERIFNNTPFFTNEGTCYTTKEDIVENYASSMSSIKIWLNISEEASPGIYTLFFVALPL